MREGATLGRRGRFLYYHSRNPAALWGMAVFIVGLGVAASFVVSLIRSPQLAPNPLDPADLPRFFTDGLPGVPEDEEDISFVELQRRLVLQNLQLPDWFERAAPALAGGGDALLADAHTAIANAELSEPEQRIARVFADSVRIGKGPNEELRALASAEPAAPHADYALFRVYLQIGDITNALAALELEGERPEADDARSRLVELSLRYHRTDVLRRLQNHPLYTELFDYITNIEVAAQSRSWLELTRLIITTQYRDLTLALFLLACIAGAGWFTVLVQAAQPGSLVSARVALCVAGVALGAMSTWATLVAGYWEEEVLGIARSDDLVGGLRFFILSVGLREELIKLLFFAPLLPILLRRRDELEMLVVAGCVGLGFAIEENLGYYTRAGSLGAIGRFATANLAHITLTGVAGLWLCRAILWPKHCLQHFCVVFAMVVLVHGLYDAFISLPDLMEFGLLSFLFFLLACYQFFHDLRDVRPTQRDTVSLTATFVCGASLVVAATMVYLSAEVGFQQAVHMSGTNAVGMALATYIVLREMPGSLVRT